MHSGPCPFINLKSRIRFSRIFLVAGSYTNCYSIIGTRLSRLGSIRIQSLVDCVELLLRYLMILESLCSVCSGLFASGKKGGSKHGSALSFSIVLGWIVREGIV